MIEKKYDFERGGEKFSVFTVSNSRGMHMDVSTRGGTIINLFAPDRYGNFGDVLVGYERAEDYADCEHIYNGAIIGRYCNRIGGAKFTLGGREYALFANNGKNTLHGGKVGFDARPFAAEVAGDELLLRYLSPDGEEGFPGNLAVTAAYSLSDGGELAVRYEATCDRDTVCSLTNHAYFNIGGGEDVLGQILDINASRITAVDNTLIPTGDFSDVDGTPFSFKGGVRLGRNMFSAERMIAHCHGFDFNYCLDRKTDGALEFCASVYAPDSGRYMECYTTEPGVQLYTANKMNGFKGKRAYRDHAALCLETQHYPDSPNKPHFPSATLKAGETYRSATVYKFSVK